VRLGACALIGSLLVVLSLTLVDQRAHAQALAEPPVAGTGLGDLAADPGKWASTVFNAALVGLGRKTTDDVVGFMGWLLGNGNLISQTPAGLSYASDVVVRLWETMRYVANGALAVVTVWGGVNVMVQSQVRAPYHGALELLPRLVLSAILVNTSLYWGRFVIELNNLLCQGLGEGSIPAWDSLRQPEAGSGLMNLIAMVIYLVMGLMLLGQMLMRLALVDTLLVIGPLALTCWVLPQTVSWARLWFNTFFGTVFVQFVQVLVLQLGADLIKHLPAALPSLGSDPIDHSRAWLMTLLLGVAVLQLARRVPRLMPGYPGGGGNGLVGIGVLRYMASLVRVASAAKGGR
jgi:TrbL/VirB6 plasmid conjugal transfer protein